MNSYKFLPEIIKHYNNKGNILEYFRNLKGVSENNIEDILISYDLQSGTYIELLSQDPSLRDKYCQYLADEINDLGSFNSIIEIGIGEGVTLGNLIPNLTNKPERILGFDISWSRLKYAKDYLKEILNNNSENLFVADLFNIPLPDNSVEVVYTSHTIEPNGGRELEAIREIARIASKYIILLEPAYDFASKEAKDRMEKHGYVKRIMEVCDELELKVIKHELFKDSPNKLNPTGLTIIEKNIEIEIDSKYICPITKTKLEKTASGYFSSEAGLLYPVILNIPCLITKNAILASHLQK